MHEHDNELARKPAERGDKRAKSPVSGHAGLVVTDIHQEHGQPAERSSIRYIITYQADLQLTYT